MYRVREDFDRQRPSPDLAARQARLAAERADRPLRFDLSRLEIGDVFRWIFRSMRLIAILAGLGAVAGFAVVSILPARYTVYTDLLIEPENLKVATNDLFPQRLQADAQLLDVESKMRVITSGNVLERVATKLNLVDDPDFGHSWTRIFDLFEAHPTDRKLVVLRTLSQRIKVMRQERSYMVAISVWAEHPQAAVDIAKALVESFEAELNETESREAERIASSLQGRLGALKDEAGRADAQVEAFRARHGLQKVGSGQLVSSQSLDNLNAKIADIRVQVAQATTRYNDLLAALRSGTETDALKSPIITSLRIEQATLNRKVASLSSTYGSAYPALIEAHDEQHSLDRAIASEHKRLTETAKTEVERTKSVLRDLEGEIATMKTTVADDDREQVQLRDLERSANAKAAVYQSALTRAGEVSERGRLDAVDVRAITDPTLPMKPSWPPSRPILTLAGAALGILLGIAIAIAFGLNRATRGDGHYSFA